MSELLNDLASPIFVKICEDITSEKNTAGDLYGFIVVMLHDNKVTAPNVPELRKIFYKYAKDQYRWPNSEFNILYRRRDFKVIKFDQLGFLENIEDSYEPRTEKEKQLLEIIQEEIDRPQEGKRDFMVREVMRIYLRLGSFQKVANATELNVSTVYKLFKEFKNDVRNNNNFDFLNEDSTGLV